MRARVRRIGYLVLSPLVDPPTAERAAFLAALRELGYVQGQNLEIEYRSTENEAIVYCQSGVRAAETATVLAELGFRNVKVYDSSWLGYGNTLDAPANDAVLLNVGALNNRISGMQARIDALEKELAAARGAKQ